MFAFYGSSQWKEMEAAFWAKWQVAIAEASNSNSYKTYKDNNNNNKNESNNNNNQSWVVYVKSWSWSKDCRFGAWAMSNESASAMPESGERIVESGELSGGIEE